MMFYYTGRSSDGRRLRGSIEAVSRDAAAAHLRSRFVFVTGLETVASVGGTWTRMRLSICNKGIRPIFFRSFGALVNAGVPVRSALETIIQSSEDSFSETLSAVEADIDGGATLSTALERHPNHFSAIAIAMVKAGELGGSLDEALRTLAEFEERDRALRKRVAAALAYPCVVSIAAAGLLIFLVAGTMPAFASMFAQMRVSLPAGTRLLIAAASELRTLTFWGVLLVCLFPVIVALRHYKTSDAAWAKAADRVRLRFPLLGQIVVKSTVARFARSLASLMRAGVDIISSLETAAGVVEGFTYRHGLRTVIEALRRGNTLAGSFEASGLFDITFLQLLRAGEESGTVDDMLFRIARHYEVDVEASLSSLASIIEPLLICVLGAAIGTIVASIIIPLYSMIGNIQ